MDNLRRVLADTLLLACDPNALIIDQELRTEFRSSMFRFRLNTNFPLRITDFMFDHINHKNENPILPTQADVCDQITFSSPRVRFKDAGSSTFKDVILPLEKDYLVAVCQSEGGKFPLKIGYWYTRMNSDMEDLETGIDTDIGVQMVYAYKFKSGKIVPVSMNEKYGQWDDFLQDDFSLQQQQIFASEQSASSLIAQIASSGRMKMLDIVLPRFLVTVSFVCCQPDAVDPFAALNAARFFPVVMLKGNCAVLEIQQIKADIKLSRKPTSSHSEHHNSSRQLYFFTDRNILGDKNGLAPSFGEFLPEPHWGGAFDYYKLNPEDGKAYVLVDRMPGSSRATTNRTAQTARQRLGSDPILHGKVVVPAWKYVPTDVEKFPGQGDFDNIHIAPLMQTSFGTEAYMAPVCQHDCLHTHLRWGRIVQWIELVPGSARREIQHFFRGWSDDFLPYSTFGAPLVPPNQTIRVTRFDAGFLYSAETHAEPAQRRGTWYILYHHGSYYGYSLNSLGIKLAFRSILSSEVDGDFYYKLRFNTDYFGQNRPWIKEDEFEALQQL